MPKLPKHSDSDFSARLQAWRVEAEVPADFRRAVWSRIAHRRPSLRERLLQYWQEPVRRPAHALAGAALALTVAFGAAHHQAGKVNASRWQAAEQAYVHSISPTLQVAGPAGTFANHRDF